MNFLRNTDLDARNYFSPTRGAFDQNQFGGTFGGPIRKNKIFFFGDYQGTRSTQGVDTGQIPVPSLQDRTGNLLDLASSFVTTDANGNTVPTTVSGPYWASLLSQKLGYAVSAGEPYYTPGCTNATLRFPERGRFPRAPGPRRRRICCNTFPRPTMRTARSPPPPTTKLCATTRAHSALDANTRWGLLSAYYFLDDWSQNNPYPVAQGGANVPGFNALYTGRAQLLNLGDTKTLSATAVNEFHFSYMRDANDLGKPVGGVGVSLASQGFEVGQGTPGIVPLSPKTEGVESVGFNSFTIGTNTNELKPGEQHFQWLDNFSKVTRNAHDQIRRRIPLRSGQCQCHRAVQWQLLFFGTETGSDFADFLLGIPSQYNQSQLQPFYGRNKYCGPLRAG